MASHKFAQTVFSVTFLYVPFGDSFERDPIFSRAEETNLDYYGVEKCVAKRGLSSGIPGIPSGSNPPCSVPPEEFYQ